MSRTVTTPQLAALIAPFVGAKLNPVRDPNAKYGGYLPPKSAVDISVPGQCFVNADVRAVTDEGVEVFFYKGCDLLRWADIRRVTVAGLDADGDRTGVMMVEHRERRAA